MYRMIRIPYKSWKTLIALALCGLGVGLLTGLVLAFVGQVFQLLADVREQWFSFLVSGLVIVGLVIVYVYQTWGGSSSQGLALVFEIGQGHAKTLPRRMPFLALICTWLTHLFGGSAGRTGVAVQIGASFAQQFQSFLSLPDRQRLLMVTGIAAGFAGLFQTPWTATVFACEVLILGQLQLFALFPALISAFVASTITTFFGLSKFHYTLTGLAHFDGSLVVKVLLLGLVFGLVGDVFAIALIRLRSYLPRFVPNPYWRMLIFGMVLATGLFICHFGRYAGTGSNLIAAAFAGERLYAYDWLLKVFFTLLTMSIGFQGGEVTPLLAIGASLGAVLAPICQMPVSLGAALGYLSVFGSATNTFLVPLVLGVELFGWDYAPLFALCAFVATRFNRQLSIYPFQLILES